MNNSESLAVLGIHPTSRGISWVLFEGALAPFDWANAAVAGNHEEALERVASIIDRYKPDAVALEAFSAGASRRHSRIQRLAQAIIDLAVSRGVDTRVFSLTDVHGAFAASGAQTRQQIAQTIADHIPALRHRLPPERRSWMGEHPNLPLFSAAACALTYYATVRGA